MELLKTTGNPPWGAGRSKRFLKADVEYLRDMCLLDITDEMEWKLFLNGEVEEGKTFTEFKALIDSLIKMKEKRRRNFDRERRLVIWTSRLSLFNVYVRMVGDDLTPTIITKFINGRTEHLVMSVSNKHLEFRNFDLIAGEPAKEVNLTYSFNSRTDIGAMKSFIEMRMNQGLSDWTQLNYTIANNSIKLFYRGFSAQTKQRLRLEILKRTPSLELTQYFDHSSKGGVLLCNKNIMNRVINNVYASDVNEAFNSQYVRGDDFPIGKPRKVDPKELKNLVKGDKYFFMVIKSNEVLNLPPWIKPFVFEDNYYYMLEQYDYKSLRIMGLTLKKLGLNWSIKALYTCDEIGYLDWKIRQKIAKMYGKRRYLKKKLSDPSEKIIKAELKFLYGKGLQCRNFENNTQVQAFYNKVESYMSQAISYHAMARNRYEIITMLDRLDWNYAACDTDGIKTQHPNAAAIFAQRNEEIREENIRAGFLHTEIGLWKCEGLYPRFIQFGNKVYAYEKDGELVCKFAGCLKEAWKAYFSQFSLDDCFFLLENCDVQIPKGCVRRRLKMNDNGVFYIKKDYLSYGLNGTDREE